MISMPAATVFVNPAVLGVNGKVLAVRGLQGWPLREEAGGCPVPGPAGSNRPTQLSPSAKLAAPLGKLIYERAENATERRREQKE